MDNEVGVGLLFHRRRRRRHPQVDVKYEVDDRTLMDHWLDW